MNPILPNTTKVVRLLSRLTAVLLFAAGFASQGIAQTGCEIIIATPPGCPQNIYTCATKEVNGVLSADATWTPPQFSLSCPGQGGTGFSFNMSFDLNESQSAAGCWAYNYVQRTGNSGGQLQLWQSSPYNGSEAYPASTNPWVVTPAFYLAGTTNMQLSIFAVENFTVNVYLVNPGTLAETLVSTTPPLSIAPVTPTNAVKDYPFTVTPTIPGAYRLRFEFVGGTSNANYVDIMSVNATLLAGCSGDVNFSQTSNYNPGATFPIGTTAVTYTATCLTCTAPGPLTATCTFNVVVNGLTASVTGTTPTTCGLANGSITIAAAIPTGGALASSYQYSLDGGAWTTFTTPYTITGVTGGAHTVNVRGYFDNYAGYCNILSVLNTNVGTSADVTPPDITCPTPAASYNTDAGECTSSQTFEATATDNCSVASIKYYLGPGYTTEITAWPYAFPVGTTSVKAIATDASALTDECVFDVVVVDNQAPVLTGSIPAGAINQNLCFNAIPDGPSEATIAAQYTDNCSSVITVTKSGTPTGNDCSWSVTYTYVVKDQYNNTVNPSPTVTYSGGDKTPPALTGTLPSGQTNMNLCYNAIPVGPTEADIAALYTDGCGGAITVSKSGAPTGTDCNWSVTYTYTVKDKCDNFIASPVTITYSGGDKTPPALTGTLPTGESNMNLCFSAIPAGPTEAAIAALYTDACGGAITVSKSGAPTGTDCSWSVTYTYTVKDKCDNFIASPVTITYSGGDKTPPALTGTLPTGESNMNLCYSAIPVGPTEAQIAALYTDGCGGTITVSKSGTPTGTDCNWSVTYTYTVKDKCNNFIASPVTITYSGGDKTPPEQNSWWNSIGNINACLNGIPGGPTEAQVAAAFTDNCGGPITVVKSGTPTGTDCNWSVTYSYTVRDKCNNYYTAEPLTVSYSGGDQTPPVLTGTLPTGQTNMNLCYSAIPAGPTEAEIAALYTDACGGPITVVKSGTPTGNNVSWSVTYSYTVRDKCNNFIANPVTITYSGGDKTNPVITTCAPNKTINTNASCQATVPDFTADVVASDGCGGSVTITQSPAAGSAVGPTLGSPITVTITVRDAANNATTCTATLTVIGPIVADDDANATPISGYVGGTAIANVLANDDLNCGQASLANVNLTVVTPAANAGVVLNTTTGAVTVAPLTPAGTYTIIYRICEKLVPTNCDNGTVTVNVRPGSADLSITKTGPANVNSGGQITYTITVTNNGLDISDNTTITDNVAGLLTGAQFSTNGGTSYSNWTGSYIIPGSMASGSSVSILLRGTISAQACTSVSNTATVAGALPDPNMTNNSATAVTPVIDVTPPSITCGPAVSATADGSCLGINVELLPPVVTDNCALPLNFLTAVRSDGKLLTDMYPLGTTTVTWTATDGNGNTASCTQTVKVIEGNILANYTFVGLATAASYPFAANETATGISSEVTSTNAIAYTGSGLPSGPLAFKSNLGTNEALVMQPSSGNNTRYFQFVVSGSTLKDYGQFQLYLQAERNPQAATTLTFAYSKDGVTYTNNGTLEMPLQSSWYEKVVDWSGVAALNTYDLSTLYIRIYMSGSSAGDNQVSDATRVEIDNFQVYSKRKPLMASITAQTNVLCRGAATGSATVTATGGTAPYTYSWNTNPVQTTQTATNLTAGTYTVTVTDSKGCTTTAVATITQPATGVDVTLSSKTDLLCPGTSTGSITVSATGGTPGYTYSLDNVTYTNTTGTFSGLTAGNYTVWAKDANGCKDNVAVSIVVLPDVTKPTITTCPAPQSASANASCMAAVPNFVPGVVATDNCTSAANLVITQSPAAGTMVTVGVHTITITVRDEQNNTQTCTTTFTVTDNTNPVITTCPAPRTISANASCMAAIPNVVPDVVATDNCTASGNLTITQSPATGTMVGLGQYTITITVKDAANNTITCTTTVTVADNTNPVITTCPAPQSAPGNANCMAAVPNFVPGVVATDNCTASGSLTITQSPAAGTMVGVGPHTVTITVKDAANNTITCTTTFTVTDNTNPVITTCPAPQSAFAGANCTAPAPNFTVGVVATDNCSSGANLTVTQSPTAGTPLGIGTHTITITVRDAGNNIATCTTTFTVSDNTPPSITCPANITTVDDGCATATVIVGTPQASDNCTTVTVAGVRSDSKPLTDPYPIGTTTITWTATDGAGLTATCTQTVVVTKSPGTILANYTFVGAATGSYPFNANETAPGITSNVTSTEPFAYTGSGTPSGALAFKPNVGTNEAIVLQPSSGNNTRYLQYVVSGANLKFYNMFKVYLQAERQPQGATTVTLAYSTDGTSYTMFGTLSLTEHGNWYEKVFDLSGVAALNACNLSNLYFRLYASGSDANGTSDATRLEVDNFQVFGEGAGPVITCGAPVTATVAMAGDCSATATVPAPTTESRCGTPVVTSVRSDGKPLSDPFPIGVTTITWTATDPGGAFSTCTQTVTVKGLADAVNDAFTAPSVEGGNAGNALGNDLLDCQPVQAAGVNITVVTGSGNAGVTLNTTSGEVTVAPGTPAGTYTIVYRICDKADPTKCDEATITIVVDIATPVTGLELKGFRNGGDVQLTWYTVTEQSTSHFIVERSFNGVRFQPIPTGSRVAAAGNSTDRRNYSTVDKDVQASVVYYRVRLIDANGNTKLSNVVAITQNISRGLRVYPNPVRNYVTVEFGENGTYQIDLISSNGQLIMLQKDIQVTNTFRTLTLQRHNLISGQYEMRITNKTTGKVNTIKLVYLPNQTP